MKLCPLGANLFHAERESWTGKHEETNSRILQFCKCS